MVVGAAAVVAVAGRAGGFLWPLRPDEAGYLLAARAWSPLPDSLFHPYFVDRPPSLLLLIKATDAIGGPYFLRFVAALGCGLAVLLAAAFTREAARSLPRPCPPTELGRAVAGAAVLTAALLLTGQIDPVGAKGELLGVPLVLGSAVLALRALRTRSTWLAGCAGLVAMSAVGLKQSLLGGLVFGAVLLLAAVATRRVDVRAGVVLGAAATAGAAVPVLATVAGTLAVGADLASLEYAVLGFRNDAARVLLDEPTSSSRHRMVELTIIFATSGMALVVLWCLARARVSLRRLPAPVAASLATLAADLVAIGVSGSFWKPYLFALAPSLVMAWACTQLTVASPTATARDTTPTQRWRPRLGALVVAFCVASTLFSLAGAWAAWARGEPPRQYILGKEIGRVSGPDDTLVVYGGRADIQWASGLGSPYEHLWSLPMRTLDPDLSELDALLAGPDAPTWLVAAVSLDAWGGLGARHLRETINQRYAVVGTYCGMTVWRRVDAPPVPALDPDCETPWGRR